VTKAELAVELFNAAERFYGLLSIADTLCGLPAYSDGETLLDKMKVFVECYERSIEAARRD
jgi:hypothetical protein